MILRKLLGVFFIACGLFLTGYYLHGNLIGYEPVNHKVTESFVDVLFWSFFVGGVGTAYLSGGVLFMRETNKLTSSVTKSIIGTLLLGLLVAGIGQVYTILGSPW